MIDVAERLARAGLCRVGEPDDTAVRRLVASRGPVAAWQALRAGSAPPDTAAAVARAGEAVPERDLERAGERGGRFVCPGDPDWPAGLDVLADRGDAPYGLWLRGPGVLAELTGRAVAVVGARAATAYGVHVAGELAAGLADARVSVVSGGAYGIDGAAHRGALAVGGPTIAVLACGVDVSYPRGHDTLLGRIAETGLLVSELPPGAAAMRHRFLTRNRLIAALSAGTVVVEAAVRSGALSTARWADQLSRPLMAVPGPVTSVMSAGCHHLVRECGALLVTGAAQVLEAVDGAGGSLLDPERGPERGRDRLAEPARRVLDAVPVRRPAPAGRIALAAGLEPHLVLRQLAELAGSGFVERCADGWRLQADGRP